MNKYALIFITSTIITLATGQYSNPIVILTALIFAFITIDTIVNETYG